jgi:hypothetical protein
MSRGYKELIANTYTAGTLFNGYTTAKSVIPPEGLVTLPQGYLNIGRRLHVSAQGGISSLVTTPGAITLQVMLGSIVVFTTGALQLNATAHTTIPFWFDAYLTVRTYGATTVGTMMGQGLVFGAMFTKTAGQVDAVNGESFLMAPNTAPAVGTGYDSTAAQTLDFWAGFSISNAANGIQVQMYGATSEN